MLIDAPLGIWEVVKGILEREKCRLTELWITHGHWDHTQGGAELVRQTNARTLAHADDKILIETPEIMDRFMAERRSLEPIKVDRWVGQGEKLEALGTTAEVRHVPGHCPGNILFYFPALNVAIVGDAIFRGSIGRVDLPGGDFDTLERSIREQIYSLPPDTVLFPGHGPKTTVDHEKKNNPYVTG